VPYRSEGKSAKQVLRDYEDRLLDADYGGSTTDYLQAAIMVKAAQGQRRWAMVAALAACVCVVIEVVALIVAAG